MKLKKLLVLLMIFLLALSACACGKNENTESTEKTINDNMALNEDDTIDPENTENSNGIGATINAEQLSEKKGKANGIDVSKWQGKIDWKKVKASGMDFAIIRIGYRAENGRIYKDEYADYNIQQADKAGMLVGAYFFSTAINKEEALEEARWTVEAVKSYSISYPLVYDCEGFLRSDSRMYGIQNSLRTDCAMAFLDYVSQIGYDAMLYAAKSELENEAYWETARIAEKYKIWVAHYSETTYPQIETPQYNGEFDMWQYTNMGKVNGIKGNTDMVVSYFVPEKAEPKSNQKAETAKAPAQKDGIYTEVDEQVTAKDIVNLRDGATTKSNIVGSLKNGDALTRTAVGNNGWSKLIYGGQTVYAISSYLTNDLSYKAPIESKPQISDGFSAINEIVTAKEVVNLRDGAGTSFNIVGTLNNGETATRIGINNSSGWSKLTYNGQTVYAVSSYLTTDLNFKPAPDESEKNNGYVLVEEQVTAKSETNLRTVDNSKDPSTIVYTLKNGEYVTRVGINNTNGWSMLLYNGQTVYAISSYLTK